VGTGTASFDVLSATDAVRFAHHILRDLTQWRPWLRCVSLPATAMNARKSLTGKVETIRLKPDECVAARDFVVKKTLAIWLMVMIYAFSACGGISAAGCCMDEATPVEAEHSDHQHYHSQAQVSVHAFLHALSAADYSVIVSHQCCCLASSPGDDVQLLHIVRNHRPGAETFAAHHLAAFIDSPAFRPEFPERSFCSANGPRDHNPTVASIRSVSLLI
jgi:hypothetical protein